MNVRRAALLFLALGAPALAQEGPAAFLARSLAAYGPVASVKSLTYVAEGTAFNRWQAFDPAAPDALPTAAKATLRLDRGDFHLETEQRFPGGYLFHFVAVGQGTTAFTYDVTGSRVGQVLIPLDAPTRAQTLAQATDRLPFWRVKALLAQAKQDATPFTLKPEGLHTRLSVAGPAPTDYVFDLGTSRLRRIETTRPNGLGDTVRIITTFATEVAFDGLWQPTLIRTEQQGRISQAGGTERLTQVQVNHETPGLRWEAPKDRVPDTEGTALVVARLSDTLLNVYDLSSGRNLPFWRTGDQIVAFDAPLAPAFCDKALAEAKKVWPQAKLGAVVLTHFHNDHVSGLARYVKEGARIYCSETARPLITELLALQGLTPTFAPIQEAPAGLALYDVPNRHVKGLLLAHLPQEGVIYEGDLLTLPADGTLTPPLDVTKDFFAFLKAHPLAYTRIIGHHGHSRITPELMTRLEALR